MSVSSPPSWCRNCSICSLAACWHLHCRIEHQRTVKCTQFKAHCQHLTRETFQSSKFLTFCSSIVQISFIDIYLWIAPVLLESENCLLLRHYLFQVFCGMFVAFSWPHFGQTLRMFALKQSSDKDLSALQQNMFKRSGGGVPLGTNVIKTPTWASASSTTDM